MTSPNGEFPAGAYGGSTVSQMQNVTQASVAAGQSAQILDLLGDVWDSLIDNLLGGFSDVVGTIAAAINKFIRDLVYALKGVTGGFVDLTGFFKDTDTKADQAIDIVTVVQQQVTAFDVKTNRPIGETITPLGYGPFPRSQLVMLPNASTGSGGASGSTHSHSIGMDRDPAKVFSNVTIVTFVRITADDAIKLMYFYAKGTPTSLIARFYRMSAAGDLTELLGTSGELASNILGTWSTQLVTFPEEALTQTGDYLALCLTVTGSITVAGIENFDPAPLPGFNPIKNGATIATTSPGATVTRTALSFTAGWVTYIEASRSIGQEVAKRALQDLYDRPDGPLGNAWSIQRTGNGPAISGLAAAWGGTADGHGNALHTTPLTTTKTHGRITVGSVNSSASERFAGAIVRSNSARTSWGGLFFDNNEYSIVRGTSVSTFAKLFTLAATPVAGDVLEWDLNGPLWIVKLNGAVIVNQEFPTISYGPGNLYEGIYLSRDLFQSSGRIADWLANDISDL